MGLGLEALIEVVGAGNDRQHAIALAHQLDSRAPNDWRNLAAVLAVCEQASVVGIGGAQGTGKSTLAGLLVRAIQLTGRSAAGCSLDDFYLSHQTRAQLAQTVHPLLATRGVPGTHDVQLALQTLAGLTGEGSTRVPVFDKANDDPLPQSAWKVVAGPVSQVVFEGWCLGASAQPRERLREPVNPLEAQEDSDAVWRRYVNDALAAGYQALWNRVDFLVYLQAPDFEAVARWRTQQEQQLPRGRRMGSAALARFLAHYERLTLWMLETMPGRADLVVELDVDHTIARVQLG
jgi:D-glycerate 3-kinase